MPLGLSNTPRTFQKLTNSVFQEDLDQLFTVYLDNILMYSFSTLEHLQYIEWVLSKLRSNSLFAKSTKYEFDLTELEYSEYIISSISFKPDLLKSKAIKQWASPISKNCKPFLVSITIIITFCTILHTLLPLFMLYIAKRLLIIGLKLRIMLCTPCSLNYAAILLLLCLTLPNHSKLKVMHLTLL